MKIIKYQDKYKNAFIQLNLAWIERFYRVEESDINMLEHIDDHIQNGAMVYLLHKPVSWDINARNGFFYPHSSHKT
ncbi:hypothetical protein DPQ25_04555 [Hydrogeniiclostridium mannosilyticum]|uniref:Uncharacterized protein n=1 Tax=Hydrogeniiclostridium mannosilyticum TaxID=2764322 RepID=A0A328UFY4_9FIRM|nr:hypothetical protein DPQ25_04555 [Hydrogeniiclostridium mannosilyticum]